MPQESDVFPFHLFDREADVLISERRLPHWAQAGAIAFITWRTEDSIPAPVLAKWRSDRCRWLRSHGIDPNSSTWKSQLLGLVRSLQGEFFKAFSQRWHDALDSCHGACVLRRTELALIVAESLKHFDDDRYILMDFVVMPNHIHLLAAFPDQSVMLAQCESWKHFMATQINRRLGRRGRFWEQDGFDHLVRTEEQFHYLRRYIAQNPTTVHLGPGEFLHFSRPLPT